MTESPLIDELIELSRNVWRGMYAPLDPIWLELDLSMAQLRTLMLIDQYAPVTIGRIAEIQAISLPTASQLVERLVQARWIERVVDPQDRRRALTRLSARGVDLVERLRHGNRARIRERLLLMSDADRSALLQGLRGLQAVADQVHNP